MRAMLINMRGITLSQEKKTNRITVNATFDSGVHVILETDFNDKIVTWNDGRSTDGSVAITFSSLPSEAIIALLRILREFDPNVKMTYQLGGYTMPAEAWFRYVFGREPYEAEIP